MLAGCSVAPVKHTDVDQQLPDRVAPLAVGETTRAQVRSLLGEPQLASEYWRFDLFRFSGKNISIGLIYLVPFSVTQDVDALALVSYDAEGKVAAFDKGSSRALPGWGEYEPPIKLEAGDLTAAVQVGRITSIYVSAQNRDAYLDGHGAHAQCTVLVGCDGGSQCFSTWTLDGKPRPPLAWNTPTATRTLGGPKPPPYPVRAWVTPELISPGEHQVQVLERNRVVADATLDCGAGQVIYMLVDRPVQIFREAPERFSSLPMLIYRDAWLLPQEPGHE